HDRRDDSWTPVAYEYTCQDQAYAAMAACLEVDYETADPAGSYLLATQRANSGREGWFVRPGNGDWTTANPVEYSNVDGEVLRALAARLRINQAPWLLYGGYMDSEISYSLGGRFNMLAAVVDSDSMADIERVLVYYNGLYTGYDLPGLEPGLFGILDTPVGPGSPVAVYCGELVVEDVLRAHSDLWPYLGIKSDSRQSAWRPPFITPWYCLPAALTRTPGAPFLLMAGYEYTTLYESAGGRFICLAAVHDPDGLQDVASVEIHYAGLPTGCFLRDDGTQSDFAAGDGVYGYVVTIGEGLMTGMAGEYTLELVVTDTQGNRSDPWPYFIVPM
ncbi:hypothetical protein JW905_07385, partial [bacterium]|nr:hypothetical protein [candidate division CSSED10-310 bacterium]